MSLLYVLSSTEVIFADCVMCNVIYSKLKKINIVLRESLLLQAIHQSVQTVNYINSNNLGRHGGVYFQIFIKYPQIHKII